MGGCGFGNYSHFGNNIMLHFCSKPPLKVLGGIFKIWYAVGTIDSINTKVMRSLKDILSDDGLFAVIIMILGIILVMSALIFG